MYLLIELEEWRSSNFKTGWKDWRWERLSIIPSADAGPVSRRLLLFYRLTAHPTRSYLSIGLIVYCTPPFPLCMNSSFACSIATTKAKKHSVKFAISGWSEIPKITIFFLVSYVSLHIRGDLLSGIYRVSHLWITRWGMHLCISFCV